MHNDADQGVEEDGKVIFVARLIGEWKTSWVFMAGFLASDIMVQGDEDIGQRTCWLQINKIVVLNIKLSLLEGSRCYVAFPLNGNVSQIREPEKPKFRNTQKNKHTWMVSPTTNIIATEAIISAWFWITNSWLKIGGFLLEDFLPKPGLIAISCFDLLVSQILQVWVCACVSSFAPISKTKPKNINYKNWKLVSF